MRISLIVLRPFAAMSTGAATSSTTLSSSTASTSSGDSAPPLFIHPAAAVYVKAHVPFMLETKSNYMKWVSYFKVLCGKFGLRPHIDTPGNAFPDDPQWAIADSCIKSWLFGSVGYSVFDLALASDD